MAACVMFGRALEAVCRDVLRNENEGSSDGKHIMLASGIRQLKENKIIDERLFDWSQHLQAFRNLAAHPDEEFSVSREDATDLQTFVTAITEYIYNLTDRYEDFKGRAGKRAKRAQIKKSTLEDF